MKVFKLLFIIVFLFLDTLKSQFSISINPNIDTLRLCQTDISQLNYTLSSVNNNTSNYTVSQIPYQSIPYNGTTAINTTGTPLVDDQVTGAIPIGFTFCFFGNQYNQCYIGSNGWLGFSPGQTAAFTSQIVPSTNVLVPRNCIMGPWYDLNPGVSTNQCGGNIQRDYIRYRTEGTAPYRRFIVSWVSIPLYQCIVICGAQQIIIYESTNIIENHIERKSVCMAWAGGTATQALHNIDGTIAVPVPGRNATVWTTTNNSWRWTPISSTPPNVSWFIDNIFNSNGPTLNIQNWNIGCYNIRITSQWDCVFRQFTDDMWVCIEDCCPVNTGPIYTD
jgi:hypothetical protein